MKAESHPSDYGLDFLEECYAPEPYWIWKGSPVGKYVDEDRLSKLSELPDIIEMSE